MKCLLTEENSLLSFRVVWLLCHVAFVVGCFFTKYNTETIGYLILLKLIYFSLTNGTMEILCELLKMYPFLSTCWSKLLGDTGSILAFTGIFNN